VRDDEIIEAITADLLTALGTPESLGVARIVPSVGGSDFLDRDIEGQLPAVGVADIEMERAENLGVAQKQYQGRVAYEVSVAASAEGDGTVAGRDTVRRVLGLINKVLDFRMNPFLYRFVFIGYSVVPHPRQSAVIGVARFETRAIFGKE